MSGGHQKTTKLQKTTSEQRRKAERVLGTIPVEPTTTSSSPLALFFVYLLSFVFQIYLNIFIYSLLLNERGIESE